MTGTPLLKRAYNLGLKAVPNFECLPTEVIEYYEQHLDQIPLALTRGFVIEMEPVEEPEAAEPAPLLPLFSIVARTSLGALGGKKTRRCFKVSHWYYRDSDFDKWLSANQPEMPACEIATLAPSRTWIFVQAAAFVLGLPPDTPVKALGEGLIAAGHTMTMPQAEKMVEKTEAGAPTGIKTDGHASFFFVETGDPNDPVSVGYADRRVDDRYWFAFVYRLGFGCGWGAGLRLLLRNVDASKLGA